MPANLATASDPRFHAGAYITDGQCLFLVIGARSEPAARPYGAPHTMLDVEDCASGELVTPDLERVRRGCRLIEPAIE